MSDALVIVDTSRIAEGRRPDVERAFRELAAFVKENEPQALAYQVHFDETGNDVTVIQVHPDSASAESHMRLAGPRFAPFAGLLQLQRIDVYGTPSATLLDQLRGKATLLGGAPLVVHPFHAGFARLPDAADPGEPGATDAARATPTIEA
jgi:quinol monooxygenase YgiN